MACLFTCSLSHVSLISSEPLTFHFHFLQVFMSDIVIRVENLYKEYRLGTISHGTLYRDLQRAGGPGCAARKTRTP
jgi:hypothetical protein